MFVTLAQAIATSRPVQQESLALVRRLDASERWGYLAAFAGVLSVTLLR